MRARGVMIKCPGLPVRYDWSSDNTFIPYVYVTRNIESGRWVLPYNGQEKKGLREVIRNWMDYVGSPVDQIRMISAGLEISTGPKKWNMAWPKKGVSL